MNKRSQSVKAQEKWTRVHCQTKKYTP